MGWRFWLRRYGPAEVACLVGMLAASVVAAGLTDSPPLLAASTITGATLGFYGVLATAVVGEQRRAGGLGRGPISLAARTALLLAAEFGVAEVLDTLLWRPALMMAAVVLTGQPVWGLLAGKIVADGLFYVVAAVGYRGTEVSGLRSARRSSLSHM